MSRYNYGGQAVIEGVMMRGRKNLAIAVRTSPDEIVLETRALSSVMERVPFLKWPVIRGFVALIESLTVGVSSLAFSANLVVESEGEGETISPWEMTLSVAVALVLGIGLFFLLPAVLAHLLDGYVQRPAAQNLVEGFFRIGIFLAYVWGISFIKDIKRVFQYHGAEHKVIHTYEANQELTVENARRFSTLHPRCGTSFLLVVMVVSIFIFTLLGEQSLWMRLLSRVILLPLVAGISYEFIKLAGKYPQNRVMRMLSTPGLLLQKLTTGEPDDSQLEVAIRALKGVLDKERLVPGGECGL